MPYRYTTFDGVSLPAARPEDDLGVGSVPSTLLDSLGGVFDYTGGTRRLPKRHSIAYRGKYVGDANTIWVDETGAEIVDENGDNFSFGADYIANLREQRDSIMVKIGVHGQLIRQREEDGLEQYKMAQLLDAKYVRTVEDVNRVANMDIIFEAPGTPWRRTTATTTTDSLSSGANTVAVTVSGAEQVRDAVITITATNNITAVTITLGSHTSFTFSDTVLAGNDLVIDTGELSVTNDGVDAYDGFDLNIPTHAIDGWLILESGTNNLVVTVTGGPGTISVEHYDQWM